MRHLPDNQARIEAEHHALYLRKEYDGARP